MGRKKWGQNDSTFIKQGYDWGRKSSLFLLRMSIGWEAGVADCQGPRDATGSLKKLCNVNVALRNVINMTDSPKD